MDAFIINLSNIFDFDISMPIISGFVAEKKVWLSNESGTFPVNPNNALVDGRLFEFSNKFEHLQVTLDIQASKQTPYLFLVLGYEEWDFLGKGKFGSLPYYKIKYIKSRLYELLNKSENYLPFKLRVFLTRQNNSEKDTFLSSVEQKGYAEIDVPYWFSEDSIEADMLIDTSLRQLCAQREATGLISEEMGNEIDNYYSRFAAKMDVYSKLLLLPEETLKDWKHSFRISLSKIKTIKDFTNLINTPTNYFKDFLHNKISIHANLDTMPPIYSYVLDTSTTASGLRSKFDFTLFMLQFVIEPVIEEKNKIYRVSNIEVNRDALTPILSKLYGTIERYKKKKTNLEKEETYWVYTVNDSYYKNLPVISAESRRCFNNLNIMRQALGWFYSRDKKEKIQQAFDKNSYQDLERTVPMNTGCFSSLLKEALNKQSETTMARLIPNEITRYQQSRLVSPVDFQQYIEKRDELLEKQKKRLSEVQSKLNSLPYRINFTISAVVLLFSLILFSLPVFIWDNYPSTLVFIPFFIGMTVIAFFVAEKETQKEVRNSILALEEIRIALTNNLSQYCNDIRDAAKQMAEAFAKRETLKELKQIQKKYDEKSYRILAYEKFHTINFNSINQLSRIYNMPIQSTDESALNMGFNKHPQDDTNLIQEFPVNNLYLIINQQTSVKENIHTVLEKFEIRLN